MNEYYYARSDRVTTEREYWTNLKSLASKSLIEKEDVINFYKLYAEYLEWNNILSPDRAAIYKMAKKAIEHLEKS